MGEWIAFWNSQHSIYVNARHRDVHFRAVAQDICGYVPVGSRVLDYGCGESLHAELVAARVQRLVLCEAAVNVRDRLHRRFAGRSNIEVRSPEQVNAFASEEFEVVVMHSVAQYLTADELDELIALFHRLLSGDGLFILGDVIPPHVSALTDAAALLRFAAANGFLAAAVAGLVRTLASDYWRLRSKIGLARYDQSAVTQKLSAAGFSAERAQINIGHNPARMTFLARKK
jgi:SAM-dependent methyltransferase